MSGSGISRPLTATPAPAPERGAWQRRLVATAAVSAAAFVALALAVANGPLPIDQTAATALAPLASGIVGALIAVVNVLGQALIWDPLVGLLAVGLWLRGRRLAAIVLVAGLLGTEAATSLAKIAVNRGRPVGVDVFDLITDASYPSGHVARVTVTGGLLVALGWNATSRHDLALAAAVVFTALMGVARIAVGAHWFTDVIGAALLAICMLAIVGLAVEFAASRAPPSWLRRGGGPPAGGRR